MSKSIERTLLITILAIFAGISLVGITWGLPSRTIDRFLFGDAEPWSGEKIYRLAGADAKFARDTVTTQGADVDLDPLQKQTQEPILLNGTDQNIAKIYLRYRLYTYQPDEMITMMSLAGMNPRKLQLDPRLYQYGGLFIYPVGALIGACGLTGLIDVRSDVVYYLDNPAEFGKFYIVARAYSAVWGMIGVIVVFAIGRRLRNGRAGLFAALLFTVMPVVVCMAHEGKPHLPGAVLMLMAVLFAMRFLARRLQPDATPRDSNTSHVSALTLTDGRSRDWWLMCICCGAALGMVLSSWPIFVLIPLVAWLDERWRRIHGLVHPPFSHAGSIALGDTSRGEKLHDSKPTTYIRWSSVMTRTTGGAAVGLFVYLVANPYILINAVSNRGLLASNFGNSLAMYQISRIGEGFARVLELTAEGATWPIVIFGAVAVIVACSRLRLPDQTHSATSYADQGARSVSTRYLMLPLVAVALVFFLQFVLIGAGKPAEYGRFGIFTDTALAIGTACLLTRRWTKLRAIVNYLPAYFVVAWVGGFGIAYLANFHTDAQGNGSRIQLARIASRQARWPDTGAYIIPGVSVLAEPAPYNCPPLDFAAREVYLFRSLDSFVSSEPRQRPVVITPVERHIWIKNPNRHMPHFWPQFHQSLRRPRRGWTWPPDSPISWANKPLLAASWGMITAHPELLGE